MDYGVYHDNSTVPPLPAKVHVPAPAEYADITSIKKDSSGNRDKDSSYPAGPDQFNLNHPQWLLRRTSIHVSSEAADRVENDKECVSQVSSLTTKRLDKDNSLKKLLFKQGHARNKESAGDTSSILSWQHPEALDTGFGIKVSIEAGRPRKKKVQRQHDMKGLEQAASVKRWGGGGRPGEAWGKLQKDPEIWDPSGDALVYFGYQRSTPSFRIRSALLEEVGSEILTSKLHQGLRRDSIPIAPASDLGQNLQRMSIETRPGRPGANSRTVSIATLASADAQEVSVRYQIHFPAPDGAAGQDLLRYHITTRNFFALLLSRPLVGLTFYQALIDLHQRLQLYLSGDPNCALIIIRCLMENKLHNVCNDPAAAAGILAWSEDEEICWQEGWREGFVHCSGMYARLRTMPEFRDVSHASRALLERAHIERQVRVQEAEDHLSAFEFGHIWPEDTNRLAGVHASLNHMRKFLKEYYQKAYKIWPPRVSKGEDETWLNRNITARLQIDFDRLYDHLVDQDIVWTSAIYPEERSLSLVCGKSNPEVYSGEVEFLAKCLKRFDQRHKNTPIPYPYPLFPSAFPSDHATTPHRSSLFSSKSKSFEKRMAFVYSEASNTSKIQKGSDFASNGLVDAFIKFEHSNHLTEAETYAARMGRWILIYSTLQVLSRVSVDTPDLYFYGDVTYFLNPRLKGTPPWSYGSVHGNVYEEAHGKLAHCWRDYKI